MKQSPLLRKSNIVPRPKGRGDESCVISRRRRYGNFRITSPAQRHNKLGTASILAFALTVTPIRSRSRYYYLAVGQSEGKQVLKPVIVLIFVRQC